MSYIILVSSYFMRAIDFFGSCSGFEMSIPFANNLRTCCIAFFLIAEMDRIRSDEIAKEGQQLRKHYEGTIRALANQTPTTVSFSRMRSKGSRFTLGVWGLRVCSLDVASASATVRNRSQPSATVRVRTYGRAYGKFCRGGPFWRFPTSGCFVSRGRRGTS